MFTLFVTSVNAAEPVTKYAEIRVVDSATNRGVPLVELETVNGLKFVTDNAGRIAFQEPGLMDRELFFSVRSHGYEYPKDGFGLSGQKVTPRVEKPVEIKIVRKNAAERLCRLTGEGLYRDTLLLGHKVPLAESTNPGRVVGQDSVQAAVYKGKVHWFWGDTQKMDYPLGLFRTAGATTAIPDAKFNPSHGIAYDYFTEKKSGFARAMMPLPERPDGVIWIFGVFVVPDEKGNEKLVGHYSRRKGLAEELEQGIAVFNDEKAIFEPAVQLLLKETWRHPSTNPIQFEENGKKWILFGAPTPNVRVPATLKDVLDTSQYEAFTFTKNEWKWQSEIPPMDSKTEREWWKEKKIKPEQTRFCPADVANPNDRVVLHSGSVRWNEYRERWVMIAGQIDGKSSHLGEVWYTEAKHPTGPFSTAVKIATHDKQTFYNVVHHAFLDRDGGKTIYFEGTYTNDFSGNPEKTPRYNYNQVMYRLDLGSEAAKSLRGK